VIIVIIIPDSKVIIYKVKETIPFSDSFSDSVIYNCDKRMKRKNPLDSDSESSDSDDFTKGQYPQH
jgi:hypothetical protein